MNTLINRKIKLLLAFVLSVGLMVLSLPVIKAGTTNWEEEAAAGWQSVDPASGEADLQKYQEELGNIREQHAEQDAAQAARDAQQREWDRRTQEMETERQMREQLLEKERARVKLDTDRLNASRVSRAYVREAEADGVWTEEEHAEYERLYENELELWQLTPAEEEQIRQQTEVRYNVLQQINQSAQGLGGMSPEEIEARAQTDREFDAATKTWRKALFTGQMIDHTQEDIARQRETVLRTENILMATEIFLQRTDITDDERRAAEQIRDSALTLKASAELNQALNIHLVTLGVASDVLLLGLGGPIAKLGQETSAAVKGLLAREAAEAAATTGSRAATGTAAATEGAAAAGTRTGTTTATEGAAAAGTRTGVEATAEATAALRQKSLQEAVERMSDAERAVFEAVRSGERTVAELSQAEKQLYNDAVFRVQYREWFNGIRHVAEEGEDILAKAAGALDDVPVGQLTRGMTQEAAEALFKDGANLTREQLLQKVDLLRQGYRGPGSPWPPRGPVTGTPPGGATMPPPPAGTGGTTLPPPTGGATIPPPAAAGAAARTAGATGTTTAQLSQAEMRALMEAAETAKLTPQQAQALVEAAETVKLGQAAAGVADETVRLATGVGDETVRLGQAEMQAILEAAETIKLTPQQAKALMEAAETVQLGRTAGATGGATTQITQGEMRAILEAAETAKLTPQQAQALMEAAETVQLGRTAGATGSTTAQFSQAEMRAILEAAETVKLSPQQARALAEAAETLRLSPDQMRAIMEVAETVRLSPEQIRSAMEMASKAGLNATQIRQIFTSSDVASVVFGAKSVLEGTEGDQRTPGQITPPSEAETISEGGTGRPQTGTETSGTTTSGEGTGTGSAGGGNVVIGGGGEIIKVIDPITFTLSEGPLPDEETFISIGSGAGTTTTGLIGGGESIIDELSEPLRKISTNCQPCQSIAAEYNETIDRIEDLQSQLEDAVKKQEDLNKRLEELAINITAYDLAQPATDQFGRSGYSVKYASGLTLYFWHPLDARDVGENSVAQMQIKKQDLIRERDEVQVKLVDAAAKVRDLQFQRDAAYKALTGITIRLVRCERQCAIVEIINVISLFGNNPYDRRDPLAVNSENAQLGGSGEATVQVINNIPISRLSLVGAHAPFCAFNHYHGSADNCNGVLTTDPDPGGCGHGTVANVVTIPVSACPDL